MILVYFTVAICFGFLCGFLLSSVMRDTRQEKQAQHVAREIIRQAVQQERCGSISSKEEMVILQAIQGGKNNNGTASFQDYKKRKQNVSM